MGKACISRSGNCVKKNQEGFTEGVELEYDMSVGNKMEKERKEESK